MKLAHKRHRIRSPGGAHPTQTSTSLALTINIQLTLRSSSPLGCLSWDALRTLRKGGVIVVAVIVVVVPVVVVLVVVVVVL